MSETPRRYSADELRQASNATAWMKGQAYGVVNMLKQAAEDASRLEQIGKLKRYGASVDQSGEPDEIIVDFEDPYGAYVKYEDVQAILSSSAGRREDKT